VSFIQTCRIDADISARDRFLAPGRLMAPSQTRLVLTAITGERLWKEKIDFWNSVYGEHLGSRIVY